MAQKRKCFVMMPFSGESEVVYRRAIAPPLRDAGFEVHRADDLASPGNIITDILRSIYESDLIIADLTGRNPNVFYELGVAHTLGKYVVLLTQDYGDVPFDLKMYNMIVYEQTLSGAEKLVSSLTKTLQLIDFSSTPSSPVLDILPNVPSVQEIRMVREELQETQRQLTESHQIRQELESQLVKDKTPSLDVAKNFMAMLIKDEGIRALQLELAEKEKQIAELIAQPETTNDQLEQLGQENRKLLDQLQLMRSRLQVKPHWGLPQVSTDETYVFVLMPFREEWSDIVWEVIKNTVTSMGLKCERADDKTGRFIMQDIWSGINSAKIVIADLTKGNPNVTYEVGMCDVLGKDQILLAQNPKEVPFDFLGIRLLPYSYVTGGINKFKLELTERIESILRR